MANCQIYPLHRYALPQMKVSVTLGIHENIFLLLAT